MTGRYLHLVDDRYPYVDDLAALGEGGAARPAARASDYLASLRRRAHRTARNANIWVWIWLSLVVWLTVILPALDLLTFLRILFFDPSLAWAVDLSNLELAFFYMLLLWPGLIGFWIVRKRFRRQLRRGYFVEPSQSVKREIEPLLEGLSARMRVRWGLTLRLDLRNTSVPPSVDVERKEYYLIVPLGFLLFLRIDPDAARAVLAHELGHVVQGDVGQFGAINAYVRGVILPLVRWGLFLYPLWLALIWGLANEKITFAVLLLAALPLLIVNLPLWRLRVARRLSETAADLTAALVVGREPIEHAIRVLGGGFGDVFGLLDVHPSVDERLQNLAAALDHVSSPPLTGIRGWLALLGLWMIIAPIRFVYTMIKYYSDGANLTVFHSLPAAMIGELVLNLLYLAFLFYAAVILFKKKRTFKKVFTITVFMNPVTVEFLYYLWASAISDVPLATSFPAEQLAAAIGSIIPGLLWVAYVWRSRRVANTFVN
jgi:Protein of unknown function (DUF2569)/Peptidase family M48